MNGWHAVLGSCPSWNLIFHEAQVLLQVHVSFLTPCFVPPFLCPHDEPTRQRVAVAAQATASAQLTYTEGVSVQGTCSGHCTHYLSFNCHSRLVKFPGPHTVPPGLEGGSWPTLGLLLSFSREPFSEFTLDPACGTPDSCASLCHCGPEYVCAGSGSGRGDGLLQPFRGKRSADNEHLLSVFNSELSPLEWFLNIYADHNKI